MALAIRINNITKGSTKAVMVSSPSSNQASTYRKKDMKKPGVKQSLMLSLKLKKKKIPGTVKYQKLETIHRKFVGM